MSPCITAIRGDLSTYLNGRRLLGKIAQLSWIVCLSWRICPVTKGCMNPPSV